MKIDYKECDMLLDCYNKLKASDNFLYIAVEVPYLSRCIDMVLINNENIVITIEFKLFDWKTAIRQARDHSLGADQSYICLPKQTTNVSETMERLLMKFGVGLLLYDKNSVTPFETVIQASPRSRWNIWADSLRSRTIQLAYVNQ